MRITQFFIAVLALLVLWAGGRFLSRGASVRPERPGARADKPLSANILIPYPISTFLPQFFQQKTASSSVSEQIDAEPQVGARAAGLWNLSARETLWSQNSDAPQGIASLTKLMTALVARQYASSTAILTLTADDLAVESVNKDLRVGDQFTRDEALYFLLISSDNAIARAVGRTVFRGGIPEFVARMNRIAQELGMARTRFDDPVGLGKDVSSVSDLAVFARFVEQQYPELLSFSKYARLTIVTEQGRTFVLNNTNAILSQIPGFLGSKTGYTPEAGGSLLVVFKTDAGIFASIVLGSNDRFGDTNEILSWYSRRMSDTLKTLQ